MKKLFFIALINISYSIQAQTSYLESEYETESFFVMAFASYKSKDTATAFTIYAKKDYAITYTFGFDTDPKGWLDNLPYYDNCNNCQEDSVFYSRNPISTVFQSMEEEDIYRITKREGDKEYKIILYTPKE